MSPQRVQLSRKKGFNLQAASMAINGLPAVKVTRPGKWGNPWKVGQEYVVGTEGSEDVTTAFSAAECVQRFQRWLSISTAGSKIVDAARLELRGKNLACWCKPGAHCHADVLLEIANGKEGA